MIRRAIQALALVAVAAVALGWFVFLRPQVLGGPAAYILVSGQSMEPTIHAGSLVVAQRQETYQVGEIVVYRIPDGEPASGLNVIHRIVGGSAATGFVMQVDNAPGSDVWRPKPADILGRSEVVVPGAVSVLLVARSPIVAASVAAALAVYFILGIWPGGTAPGRMPTPGSAPLPGRAPAPAPTGVPLIDPEAPGARAGLRAGGRPVVR
jgi:signal peptidase